VEDKTRQARENYSKIPINKVNFLLLCVVKKIKGKEISHHSVQLIVFSYPTSLCFLPTTSTSCRTKRARASERERDEKAQKVETTMEGSMR
jgi:hypothetical protein